MLTVNAILDRYVHEVLPTLAPSTQGDYRRHIAVLRATFGPRVAAELVPKDFEPFLHVEAEKGRVQRNRALAVLSAAFSCAVLDWACLSHNVLLQVPRNPTKPRDRYVTNDEFERVKGMLLADSRVKTVALAMDLALTTGMIQGEIIDLRWADIDANANTLSYRETVSGKIKLLHITPKVQSILNECRAYSPDSEYVIATRKGHRYTSEGFRACWQRVITKAMKGRPAYKRRTKKPVAAAPPVLTERFTFQDIHMKWQRDRQSARGLAEVQQLISRPSETPGVELKQWMRLSEPLVRANLARHFAALANNGGGYLIFGFRDDGTPDPNHPGDLSEFNADEMASIVDKFLTPPFHCEVTRAQPPDGGDLCVVVKVPSHGSVPVCTKAGGPQDPKGRPQGILLARYYTRVNGPKSEPIDSPEQWGPIIRRCVLNERKVLLDDIAALLTPPPTPVDASPLAPGPRRDRRIKAPDGRGRVRMGGLRTPRRRLPPQET